MAKKLGQFLLNCGLIAIAGYSMSACGYGTETPTPTPKPKVELESSSVGLAWDNNSAIADGIDPVMYKPCYVDTSTRWHAGDVFMWMLDAGQIIDVVSPTDGIVVYSTIMENSGGNIFVETPYSLDGQTVYYQLRHATTLDPILKEGSTVKKGQVIGTLRWDGNKDPGGYEILDFMLFRSSSIQYDSSTPEGRSLFFDTAPYTIDDLTLIPYQEVPRCEGNPIN